MAGFDSRELAVWCVAALLPATACGIVEGKDVATHAAGAAGGSPGDGGAVHGEGGVAASGAVPAAVGAAAGEGGAAGAHPFTGGPEQWTAGDSARFLLIEGVLPSRLPGEPRVKQLVTALDNWLRSWTISADGNVIYGVSESFDGSLREPKALADGYSVFVWTPERGAVEVMPGLVDGPIVSSDGSVAFSGSDSSSSFPTKLGLYRFTEAAGPQLFPVAAAGYDDVYLQGVSPSGDVAVGTLTAMGKSTPFVWRTGDEAVVPLESPLFGDDYVSTIQLSPDGSALILDLDSRVFRGLSAAGPIEREEIPPGPYGCNQFFGYRTMNDDASLLAGTCSLLPGHDRASGFRWSAATGETEILQPPLAPDLVSADGNVLIGTNEAQTSIVWWTPTGATEVALGEFATTPGAQMFLQTPDSSVAVGTWPTDMPPQCLGYRWKQGLRVTRTGAVDSLEPLGKDGGSEPMVISADGALVGGHSYDDPVGRQQDTTHRAVVWDEQGPRDIEQELLARGVDLRGRKLASVLGIWQSGDTLRLFGWTLDPELKPALRASELWFAELPVR